MVGVFIWKVLVDLNSRHAYRVSGVRPASLSGLMYNEVAVILQLSYISVSAILNK